MNKSEYDYSIIRQKEIDRWFAIFKQYNILTQEEYHEYCKWVKNKKQPEVYRIIYSRQRPF